MLLTPSKILLIDYLLICIHIEQLTQCPESEPRDLRWSEGDAANIEHDNIENQNDALVLNYCDFAWIDCER